MSGPCNRVSGQGRPPGVCPERAGWQVHSPGLFSVYEGSNPTQSLIFDKVGLFPENAHVNPAVELEVVDD